MTYSVYCWLYLLFCACHLDGEAWIACKSWSYRTSVSGLWPDKEFNDRLEQFRRASQSPSCEWRLLHVFQGSQTIPVSIRGWAKHLKARMATFLPLKGLDFYYYHWAIRNAGSRVVVKLSRIAYLKQSFRFALAGRRGIARSTSTLKGRSWPTSLGRRC